MVWVRVRGHRDSDVPGPSGWRRGPCEGEVGTTGR